MKVPNAELVNAGLELMVENGMPLRPVPTKGTSRIYQLANGETVRVRTCNDHLLVVKADRDADDAKLNVEGTTHILVVMPQVPRSFGAIVAYLVPTAHVEAAARETHRNWLAGNPNTKGDNRAWNLWFDDDGPEKANGFGRKWAKYRLHGSVEVNESAPSAVPGKRSAQMTLAIAIASAKQMIADAAGGISPDAVRIQIDLG